MNQLVETIQMMKSKTLFAALSMLLAVGAGCATHAQDKNNPSLAPVSVPPDDGGITDAQIQDIVERVAKHQIHPLADGDYPDVTNLDQARAAKAPVGLDWNYPWGVDLFGMERSVDATDDKAVDDFVVQHNLICGRYYHWLAGLENQFGREGTDFARTSKIKGLISLGNLDSCGAMGNEILESMIRHPDQVTPDEKEMVARIADWVVHKQDRMPDGTLWRAKEYGGTVWPDDLYMGGVFLVRYGIYMHDQKYVDDAASNIIHQAALEQDSDGLWFHGWFETNHMHAPFKWGRGNGWVTVTLVETLSAMPENDPLRPQLLDILRKQIDGLKKVQAPDGMWRQVLDKPESWEESSCTAMFAYGIARAVNRGWIDPANLDVARHAFAGLAKNVTPDGQVLNTCHGTNIGTTLKFYMDRPHDGDDPHGHGPVMLAGTEILMADKK